MASTKEMLDEFVSSRAGYWESRIATFQDDTQVLAAIQDARARELTEFKKSLANQRQRDLDRATSLFSDFVARNGLKSWRFEVTRNGTIKVGRSGVRTTTVEA